MSNNRETKTIETPSGHKVVIYSYLTGREQRAIDDIALSAMEIDINGKTTGITRGKINAKIIRKTEDKMIEMLLIKLDGRDDDLLEGILNLPSIDYQAIIKAIDSVVTDPKFEDRKKK